MAKGYNLEQTGPQVQEAINKSLNLTTATQGKDGLMSAQDKQKLDSLDSELAGKVDKVPGKGLSTNDYDNTEKGKVASAYQKPVGGIPASDLAEGVIPDTSQFITKTVNDLANYYLKTETYSRSETYTKAEVDALIVIIKQFTYQVVSELPEASESTMHKLYLVPSADPQTQNVKDEYITVRSGSEGAYTYAWEQIGSTAIDLSGYVTTEALNAALANYTTTANLTTLLAAKQDVIADLSTIRTGAAAGATAYQKPSSGVPKTDLASGVQDSLSRADESYVRPYDSQSPNGMGYLVLEKDKTFASQVTAANTIYEIRHKFVLAANFQMPAGCVLYFNGGEISGAYTLTGDGTFIDGDYRFYSVLFAGSFSNATLELGVNFGGTTDFFGILRSFSNAKINLRKDISVAALDSNTIGSVHLNGNGHTITVVGFVFASTADIVLEHCVFDCANSINISGDYGFLGIVGDNGNTVSITNCKFLHVQGGINHTMFREVKNIFVEDCEFSGDFSAGDTDGGRTLFGYNYVESFTVNRCFIHDCPGIAITGLGTPNRGPVITNCVIKNMGGGGIVFFGGFYEDAFVHGNLIKNVNLNSESGGAAYSAINFHGYKNLQILDNQINTPLASGLDLEGSDNNTNNRGDGAVVSDNNIIASGLSFLSSKDTVFKNNVVNLSGNIGFSGKVKIVGNRIRVTSISSGSKYAFYPTSRSTQTFDLDAEIFSNEIILAEASTSPVWLYVADNTVVRGLVKIFDNYCVAESAGVKAQIEGYYTTKLKCLDGIEHRVFKLNLAEPSEWPVLTRGLPGRILSVSAWAKTPVTLAEDVTIHLGLYRPSVGGEATNYGDLTLTGTYGHPTSDISLNNEKPNNESQAKTGEVYATFAGSNNTGEIYLDFVCSNGKVVMYY